MFPPLLKVPRNYQEEATAGSVKQLETQTDNRCLAKIGVTKRICQTVIEIMGFRLFLDIVFILFAVSNLLATMRFVVRTYIYYMLNLEFGYRFYLSVVGISSTIGPFLFSSIADLKCVNRLMLYNTVLVLFGICSVFGIWMPSLLSQMCYSFSFGVFIGK